MAKKNETQQQAAQGDGTQQQPHLDDSLNQLASVAAGQAKSVSRTATAVYLLTASGVESYGYDGTETEPKIGDYYYSDGTWSDGGLRLSLIHILPR